MKFLSYLCNWLELLGLAVLIGGMIVIGALVAPSVFGLLPSMGVGGELMSIIFVRFNAIVVYICLALILAGFLGKVLLQNWRSKIRYIEGISLMILVGVGFYAGSVLTPRMENLRAMRIQDPSNYQVVQQFDRDHRLSERLFSINLVLGLIILYLNGMEMTRHQK